MEKQEKLDLFLLPFLSLAFFFFSVGNKNLQFCIYHSCDTPFHRCFKLDRRGYLCVLISKQAAPKLAKRESAFAWPGLLLALDLVSTNCGHF